MSEREINDLISVLSSVGERIPYLKENYFGLVQVCAIAAEELRRYESGRVVLMSMLDSAKENLCLTEDRERHIIAIVEERDKELDESALKLQQVTLERDAMLERIAELLSMMKSEYLKDGKLSGRTQHDADALLQGLPQRAKEEKKLGTECSHGQLARQCPLCEKDARIAELEQQLAMANDAAAKGDLARANAAGMDMQIQELKIALRDLWRLDGECPEELGMRVKGLIDGG